MPAETIVHVIDDDEAVRDSLAFLLNAADIEVRSYDSAARFLERLSEIGAGCIITDVRMPAMTGLELVRALADQGATMPVIMMTGHADVPLAVEAMRGGVFDFIEKPFADETILAAVNAALEQDRSRRSAGDERGAAAERLASLSAREGDVLAGLMGGHGNKAIARALGISPRTVEIYRANLMTKMGARSLSELVRLAILAGA